MSIVDAITAEPLLSAATGIFVTILGGIGLYEYRRRRESTDEVKEWYGEAIGLVGQLQQVGHQATAFRKGTDSETLQSKLDPLAADLQEQAGKAPEGVDDEARVELIYLSSFASGIVTLAERSEQIDSTEFFGIVQDYARERYDGEHDMEDVNNLIAPIETDALADELGGEFDSVEMDDEAVGEFLESFSEESLKAGQPTTIDEALEMPLDKVGEAIEPDDFWDGFVEGAMREYVQLILVEVSSEVYGSMEERRKRA